MTNDHVTNDLNYNLKNIKIRRICQSNCNHFSIEYVKIYEKHSIINNI